MTNRFVCVHVLVMALIIAVHCTDEETTAAATAKSRDELTCQAEEKLKAFKGLLQQIKKHNEPRQCSDLLRGSQRTSGVYTIYHKKAHHTGQDVYCDMKADGGGWTVIQRRGQFGNRVFNFYRNWEEYAKGFGNPEEEYWIGNEALNELTSGNKNMTLRIVLRNVTQESVHIYYSSIRVASADQLYEVQMGEFLGPPGWDAMRLCDGQKFSTYDRDNDPTGRHCAETYRGAWWYRDCHACNPNGLNLNGYHDSAGDGIEWNINGKLHHYSYPFMEMMIRPASFLEGKEQALQFFPPKVPAKDLSDELE